MAIQAVRRLGVISDTHGHAPFTRDAVRMFECLDIEVLIHCGDIGTPEIVELLARWPAHFVLGNTDRDVRALQGAIEAAGQTFHGQAGRLELGGRKIAFIHGDDQRRLADTITQGRFDLVCYGHTHLADRRQVGPTLVLNPGAVYRARVRSVALVTLDDLEAMHVPI